MTKIRLYRGISSPSFQSPSDSDQKRQKKIWADLLKRRAAGDFSYPQNIDSEIRWLEKTLRLGWQYFTDQKTLAEAYARSEGGVLVSIEVPLSSVLRLFRKEFQNFAKRKKAFELVYGVDGQVLWKNRKIWKLRIKN